MFKLENKSLITIVIIAIVLLIVLNSVIKKIIPDITGLGSKLIDDEEYKKTVSALLNSNMFSPDFYKQFNSIGLMPRSTAETWAKQIRDAWGIFNDDEDAIYDALNQAKSWAQVSQIAEAYSRLYQQDLLSTLEDGLSGSEISYMWNLLRRKPRTL